MNSVCLFILTLLISFPVCLKAQKVKHLELLNYPVGGIWFSKNDKNSGKPEDFNFYYMSFKNGADESSVFGNIFGVKNNEDTVQLMEVWNFIRQGADDIYLVQRTSWGETSTGNIQLHGKRNIDIRFKSLTSDGKEYEVHDRHYVEGPNKMRAVTRIRTDESEEWQNAGESIWWRLDKVDYNDTYGLVSPDKTNILFVSDRNGNDDLFLVNVDGTELRQLTFHQEKDFLPHWSPDGREIVFVSNRDGNFEIYKMKNNGSDLIRLTNDPQVDEAPKWSPTNKEIAFFSLRENGNPDLYIMDSDGSNLRRVTTDEGVETFPIWSKDGKSLTFTKVLLPSRNPNIHQINLKSGKWTETYASATRDFATEWISKNQVVFYSDQTGNFELYMLDKNGETTQLTDHPAMDSFPANGVEEGSLIFASDRSGESRLYFLNLEDKSVTKIRTL